MRTKIIPLLATTLIVAALAATDASAQWRGPGWGWRGAGFPTAARVGPLPPAHASAAVRSVSHDGSQPSEQGGRRPTPQGAPGGPSGPPFYRTAKRWASTRAGRKGNATASRRSARAGQRSDGSPARYSGRPNPFQPAEELDAWCSRNLAARRPVDTGNSAGKRSERSWRCDRAGRWPAVPPATASV
jgi:hypothetical protein